MDICHYYSSHRCFFRVESSRNFFQITRLTLFDRLTCRYETVTFHSLGGFRLLRSQFASSSSSIYIARSRNKHSEACHSRTIWIFPMVLIRWEDQWNMAVIGESLCRNGSIPLFDIRESTIKSFVWNQVALLAY